MAKRRSQTFMVKADEFYRRCSSDMSWLLLTAKLQDPVCDKCSMCRVECVPPSPKSHARNGAFLGYFHNGSQVALSSGVHLPNFPNVVRFGIFFCQVVAVCASTFFFRSARTTVQLLRVGRSWLGLELPIASRCFFLVAVLKSQDRPNLQFALTIFSPCPTAAVGVDTLRDRPAFFSFIEKSFSASATGQLDARCRGTFSRTNTPSSRF